MTCPTCGFDQPDGHEECLRCGLIYEKYYARLNEGTTVPAATALSVEDPPGFREAGRSAPGDEAGLARLLFAVPPNVGGFALLGRSLLYAVLLLRGLAFILTPLSESAAGESVLHLVNLPFHEAGHVVFSLLGQFVMMLGGSLMQVAVPVTCLLVFLLRTRDAFAASAALWWTGESLMDLAPYINDARALNLVLLGGVTGRDVQDYHDWQYILGHLGLLRYDHLLALLAHVLGACLMAGALLWGGFVLVKQYSAWRRDVP